MSMLSMSDQEYHKYCSAEQSPRWTFRQSIKWPFLVSQLNFPILSLDFNLTQEEKMARLKVLTCGAGIAGNALAFWLAKLGHDITVIERFPSLRATGLQIDLRGPGIQVMRRMGLEEAFQAKTVAEQGL